MARCVYQVPRLTVRPASAGSMVIRYNAVSGKYYVADAETNKAVDKARFHVKNAAIAHMESLV